jgi:hypothetical protein
MVAAFDRKAGLVTRLRSLQGIEERVMVGFGVASNPLVTRWAFFESLFRTYTFALR